MCRIVLFIINNNILFSPLYKQKYNKYVRQVITQISYIGTNSVNKNLL